MGYHSPPSLSSYLLIDSVHIMAGLARGCRNLKRSWDVSKQSWKALASHFLIGQLVAPELKRSVLPRCTKAREELSLLTLWYMYIANVCSVSSNIIFCSFLRGRNKLIRLVGQVNRRRLLEQLPSWPRTPRPSPQVLICPSTEADTLSVLARGHCLWSTASVVKKKTWVQKLALWKENV